MAYAQYETRDGAITDTPAGGPKQGIREHCRCDDVAGADGSRSPYATSSVVPQTDIGYRDPAIETDRCRRDAEAQNVAPSGGRIEPEPGT